MQAVEIAATGAHQTPSAPAERCAHTAGCKTSASLKCTQGGKWSLAFLFFSFLFFLQARLLESYLIFMGNDNRRASRNWDKTAGPFD